MKFQTLKHLRTNHDDDWIYNGIDPTYRAVIERWFYWWFDDRYLCIDSSIQSDDIWQRYFKRTINLYSERYLHRLRTEIFDFDNTLLETFVTHIKNNNTSTTNNTTTNTKTDTLKQTTENVTKNSYNTDTSGTNNDTVNNDGTNTSTSNNEQRNIHSDYPQSNVASNTTGQPSSMLWTYASDQQDSIGSSSSTDTAKTITTTSSKNSGTVEGGSNSTNTATTNASSGSDTTNTSNGSATDSGTTDTTTERHGNKADAYKAMIDFIMRCNATDWMISKLEPLFLSTFDIDDSEVLI